MKRLFFLLFSIFATIPNYAATGGLARLQEGNKRFVKAHPSNVFDETVASQAPFAVILSCADSRVPPERVFDQGIGDLFVVRVAGNIAAPSIIDSIIYATDVLKAPLIVVLGHQNCGAVDAVLQDSLAESDLSHIVPYIKGGVERSRGMQGDALENAIKASAMEQVDYLKLNPVLARLLKAGKLTIVGAYYHLENGQVDFLENDIVDSVSNDTVGQTRKSRD